MSVPDSDRVGFVFSPVLYRGISRRTDTVSKVLSKLGQTAGVKVDEQKKREKGKRRHDGANFCFGPRLPAGVWLVPELSPRCTHLAGHGGAKAAVREVVTELPNHRFVFRTDVKHYYASIQHEVLFSELQRQITDERLLDLLWQYLRRTVYDDGLCEDVDVGISLGGPLSPLMGALFLDVLDRRMEKLDVFHVRFKDDWVILAPTRWKLRKAIRIVNETLAQQQVKQHPDKTFIGRTERAFSFLGYEFDRAGIVDVAPATRKNFVERISQLYEHGASLTRIGDFVRRWKIWIKSGLTRFDHLVEAFLASVMDHLAQPGTNEKRTTPNEAARLRILVVALEQLICGRLFTSATHHESDAAHH